VFQRKLPCASSISHSAIFNIIYQFYINNVSSLKFEVLTMVIVKIVVFRYVIFRKNKKQNSIHTSQLPLTSEMPREVVHCCVEG